jgi:hypothetical protein
LIGKTDDKIVDLQHPETGVLNFLGYLGLVIFFVELQKVYILFKNLEVFDLLSWCLKEWHQLAQRVRLPVPGRHRHM